MSIYYLSRLAIVGVLNLDTPRPVVREIALAHGIIYDDYKSRDFNYHQQIIKQISGMYVPVVEEPFSSDDWYKIARFVSPLIKPGCWPELSGRPTKFTLKQALQIYWSYHNQRSFDLSNENFIIAPLSPDNIHTWDASLLYRYCCLRQLILNWQTSLSEMIELIQVDLQADLYSLRRKIIHLVTVHNFSRRSLINALHSLTNQTSIDQANIPTTITQSNLTITQADQIKANQSSQIVQSTKYHYLDLILNPFNHLKLTRFDRLSESSSCLLSNLSWYKGLPYCKLGNNYYLVNDARFLSPAVEKSVLNNATNLESKSKQLTEPANSSNTLIKQGIKSKRKLLSVSDSQIDLKLSRPKLNSRLADILKSTNLSELTKSPITLESTNITTNDNDENLTSIESVINNQDKQESISEQESTDQPDVESDSKLANDESTVTNDQSGETDSNIILHNIPIVPYPKSVDFDEVPNLETLKNDIITIISNVRDSVNIPSNNWSNYISQNMRRVITEPLHQIGSRPRVNCSVEQGRRVNIIVHERLKAIKVDNQAKAIIVAATMYRLDISQTKNPLREYNNLMEYDGKPENYLPLDNDLFNRMRSDHVYIDGPLLNYVFNPYLPRDLYHPDTIDTLLKSYGWTINSTRDDPYTLLQTAILTDNFYPGKATKLLRPVTPIELAEIADLNPYEVVSYGCPENGFFLIKYSELYDLFNNYLYFHYPKYNRGDPDIFQRNTIMRLLIICHRRYFSGESQENVLIRNNLVQIITKILEIEKILTPEEQLFRTNYLSGGQNRRVLNKLLALFFDLTMKMRGWLGKKSRLPYPISDAPVTDSNLIAIKVSRAISRLDRYCGQYDQIADLFLKLPLYQYRGNYVRSDDQNQGLTIRDRLHIVRHGEDNDLIHSCIRSSSNWFAATHCRMLTIINQSPLIDIRSLAHIS